MFTTLFVIKLLIAIFIVVGLSIISERVSPKIAGILAGYPTGSAITLFFFGLEMNPDFAANSAVYNMIGITSALFFIHIYYQSSLYFKKYTIIFSSLFAISGYVFISWILHFIELNKFIAIFIPIGFCILFMFLFKNIKNTTVQKKVELSTKTLFIRGLLAASIIMVITGVPHLIGEKWAGLLSAFPTTLFPLILIVHSTYGQKNVSTLIKNVPIGNISLIIYSLTISIVYPLYGIYLGTIVSFIVATAYLLIFSYIQKKIKK